MMGKAGLEDDEPLHFAIHKVIFSSSSCSGTHLLHMLLAALLA